MNNLKRASALIAGAILISSFGYMLSQDVKKNSRTSEKKVENIVRVLMHDRYNWTLIIENRGSKDLKMEAFRCNDYSDCGHLFKDVPAGEKMWSHIVMFGNGDSARFWVSSLEIHIHSEKDINGAGWDHGKGGRGQTQVIE